MDEAARLIDAVPPHGTVITADHQHSGRGRAPGSRWESQAGANLLLTLMLRQDRTGSQAITVPLKVGCAVAEVAAAHGLSPSIKWPNDLLIGGRKMAGVLCIATRGWLLVGVGVNCNQCSFPSAAREATSFALCLGRNVNRLALECEVLASMHRLLSAVDWLDRLRVWLAGVGGPASVEQGGRTIAGVLLGVDQKGALLLSTGAGTGAVRRVLSGSLTLGEPPQTTS